MYAALAFRGPCPPATSFDLTDACKRTRLPAYWDARIDCISDPKPPVFWTVGTRYALDVRRGSFVCQRRFGSLSACHWPKTRSRVCLASVTSIVRASPSASSPANKHARRLAGPQPPKAVAQQYSSLRLFVIASLRSHERPLFEVDSTEITASYRLLLLPRPIRDRCGEHNWVGCFLQGWAERITQCSDHHDA